MGVFLSLSARLLVNLESLNMAESVGNVTKHRKAPVVRLGEDGYRLVYVPVVSGMSLAHHYQRLLARLAAERGINVTRMSLLGYFMKFADSGIIKSFYSDIPGLDKLVSDAKKDAGKLCELEERIVGGCVVADVGGFLQTDTGIKRTSRFSFSYLMPALDAIETGAVGLMPQIHVRYTPTAEKGEQALVYVENGSAVYTVSFILEASEVSRLDACEALGAREPPAILDPKERRRRVEAAVDALMLMLENMAFGAKRSRSLPHWKLLSAVAAVSRGVAPFTVSPGHDRGYLRDTLARAKALTGSLRGDYRVRVLYYPGAELGDEEAEDAERYETLAAMLNAAKWMLLRELERQ